MYLLGQLSEAAGISGNEDSIRQMIAKSIKPFVDRIYVDKTGNLIAAKKGHKPRVMLAAHMDEIGLMVRMIDKSGKIFISPLGGIEPMTLLGERVGVQTKKDILRGIIVTQELSDGDLMKKAPKIEELYVDTGLSKIQLEKLGIKIGSYVFLRQRMNTLGNNDFIYGKAMDDRIGCYILIEVAKRIKKSKLEAYFIFTTQEETGLYGATTSAYEIVPDWAIVVDVITANDSADNPNKILGHGPTLTIKDADIIGSPILNEHIEKIAKRKKIPLQLEVTDFGSSDALAISMSRGGVLSTVLGVPIRNIHTSVSIASKKDIENAIKLLVEVLKSPPEIHYKKV
ncbi:MAG: M42 family metallopeptidase [archaeon]|nr:M42 family metallopeptidase [archaeon]